MMSPEQFFDEGFTDAPLEPPPEKAKDRNGAHFSAAPPHPGNDGDKRQV
jgi:hypothetical protein